MRRGEAGALESVHGVSVTARGVDEAAEPPPGGEEAGRVTFFRSGCKPFQALPLVERGHADRFGFGPRELAVMCASHSGGPEHVEVVRGILGRIGLDESHLLCGFHYPYDQESAEAFRRGAVEPSPVYNNCSGKHAGMLALAVAEGWPPADYVAPGHPVQRAMLTAVAEVCGVSPDDWDVAVDGCSALNPRLSLAAMARGFARLARARDGGDGRERALARLRSAMAEHPELVAGKRRFCAEAMRATAGRIVFKTAAEGLLCAAVVDAGVGVAAKVHDGAERAKWPAMMAYLASRGWMSPEEAAALSHWRRPALRNHRDLVVGELHLAAEPVASPHP